MATSSYDYGFFKQFDKRIQAIEYFKGKNVRETTELNGWQVTKCKKCENLDGHKMKSVLRYLFIICR
jgi:hypothetical protein